MARTPRTATLPVRVIAAIVAVAGVAVLAAAGCSSHSSTSASTTTVPTPAKRAEVVAAGVDQVGARRAVLGAETNRRLAELDLAVQGVTAPETDCALDLVVPATVGADGFAKLDVRAANRFLSTYQAVLTPDVSTRVRACLSPASAARRAAKQLSPDLDMAAAHRLLVTATTAMGTSVGLTPDEAHCYAQKSFGDISDVELQKGLSGTLDRTARTPGSVIAACLTAARISALAPALQHDLDGLAAADEAARQQAQARIEQQARDAIAAARTSTTVAPTTAPTTAPTAVTSTTTAGG